MHNTETPEFIDGTSDEESHTSQQPALTRRSFLTSVAATLGLATLPKVQAEEHAKEASESAELATQKVWQPGPPAFQIKEELKEKFGNLAPTAEIAKGTITLANRGIAVSKEIDFEGAVTVTLEWTWVEGRSEDRYDDMLSVALMTNGHQRKRWSHEIEQGVVVHFAPHQKDITVLAVPAGEKYAPTVLGQKDGVSFKQNTPYKIDMLLDEKELTIFVDGKEILKTEIPPEHRKGGSKVAMYNREPVAGVRHVSRIRNPKAENKTK